LTVIVVYRL